MKRTYKLVGTLATVFNYHKIISNDTPVVRMPQYSKPTMKAQTKGHVNTGKRLVLTRPTEHNK